MNTTERAAHQRNWTTVGRDETDGRRERIGAIFDRMEWRTPPCDLPWGEAITIDEIIAELKLPCVSAVAISNELAPFGLLGIEANFTNGRARAYLLDKGSEAVVLCSDFWKNEGSAAR